VAQEYAAEHVEALAELEGEHRLRLSTVADRINERFVRPLALDRLCALIEPAMQEARSGSERKAFARLQEELRPLAATPTGVGLDVPFWLRRLEAEAQRVRAAQAPLATLAESVFRIPQRLVEYEDLQQQIQEWETPLA
jgi:hypothetical protein